MNLVSPVILLVAIGLALFWLPTGARAGEVRGSLRHYHFAELGDAMGRDRHTDLSLLRLTHKQRQTDSLQLEAHLELSRLSPPLISGAVLATGRANNYLGLDQTFSRTPNQQVSALVDRLNLQWDSPEARVIVGRQAIGWGVASFFPALDLFSPFAPERIDREYKAGIDAIRIIVPRGPFSSVELVGAVLGDDPGDDGILSGLWTFRTGEVDLGLMAGKYHGDTVLGLHATADLAGTAVHSELSFTDSSSALDALAGKASFWRGSIGAMRLLREGLTAAAEIGFNGFGADDPSGYLAVAGSDRFSRGEIGALGSLEIGASLTWQLHPLVNLTTAVLVNPRDSSVLLLPYLGYSLEQDAEVVAGLSIGLGPGLDSLGRPRSEYGLAPDQLYVAYKAYF